MRFKLRSYDFKTTIARVTGSPRESAGDQVFQNEKTGDAEKMISCIVGRCTYPGKRAKK